MSSIQESEARHVYNRARDAYETAKEVLRCTVGNHSILSRTEKKLKNAVDQCQKRTDDSNSQLCVFIQTNKDAHQAYIKLVGDKGASQQSLSIVSNYSRIEPEHKRLASVFNENQEQLALVDEQYKLIHSCILNINNILAQAFNDVQRTEIELSNAIVALSMFDL